jgi:hypothetical protein
LEKLTDIRRTPRLIFLFLTEFPSSLQSLGFAITRMGTVDSRAVARNRRAGQDDVTSRAGGTAAPALTGNLATDRVPAAVDASFASRFAAFMSVDIEIMERMNASLGRSAPPSAPALTAAA